MATLEEITDRFKTAIGGGTGIDKSIKFDLGEDGVIYVRGAEVSNLDQAADCTLIASQETLQAIEAGRLDPATALRQGRLKVNGDMGVVTQLAPLLLKLRSASSSDV